MVKSLDDLHSWTAFKELLVTKVCKPALKAPYASGQLTKEGYKQVLKRCVEKVVGSYKTQGLPPPLDLTASQKSKIEKLVGEYSTMMIRKGKV